MVALYPLRFNAGLHIHQDCDEDKVKTFFVKGCFSSIFGNQIQLVIDNALIKLRLLRLDDRRSHSTFLCFYDIRRISKALILEEITNILKPKQNFDDTLILLVGIKDECDQNKESNSDIGSQVQKPNVRFVEWCVNSSEQDTKEILQDFTRVVVIKSYINDVRRLQDEKWFNEDEDQQLFSKDVSTKVTSWSLDFKSLFSITLLRSLDFYRIAITYNDWDDDRFIYDCSVLWTNASGWSHAQSKTCKIMADDKLLNFDMDDRNKLPVSSRSHPISIFVTTSESDSIILFLKSQEMDIFCRSLVILLRHGALNLSEVTLKLKSLVHLVIENTDVDVKNLQFPTRLCETMKHLVLVRCNLTEVPQAVGSLIRLTVLNISNNDISTLPGSLGNLRDLLTFLYEDCPIEFPPKNVLKRSTQDVIKFLQAFQHDDESVPLNEAKLIVAGQEGVGKSTLIKAMQRKRWFNDINPPDKTDGVDIKTLQLEGTRFLVYDLAGDVEYLNTHPLFMSSKCLHLVVFDMSQILVGKGTRSVDQLCRLELWLKMIAAQHPMSYVLIVGTHADHPRITMEILSIVRKQIVELLEKYRTHHKEYFDKCILCDIKFMPQELQELHGNVTVEDVGTPGSCIPHILGYFEVSSITKYPRDMFSLTNKSIETVKSAISSSNRLIANAEFGIPKTWLSFFEKVLEKQMIPTAKFSEIGIVAEESGVHSDMVESMLRFFHSQGNFLWYEDIPEMKEMIITDPHWLSDQLRILISYRPSVNAVCDGIIHTPSLSGIWSDMTVENHQKLLVLFRSVGLCFSISDDKELFPCNLPIGWPDRQKWPPLPSKEESQTSIQFTFNFLPPTFFSKLVVEVNKKRISCPSNVEPLYFRFRVLYSTKESSKCDIHNHEDELQPEANYHKVHYEIMPHRNAMKVSIRGPFPCCIVDDVRSTVQGVQSCYYPGITVETHLICPLCEMRNVDDPAIFSLTSNERICSKSWHDVGSINDILQGKYSRPETEERKRAVGEPLEDYHCPKLFVVLPININCLSLKDRIVYSYLKDSYAVHLLCECPGQWHFVDSPGFCIAKPKEFFEKYGKHLCTVMKAINTPLRLAALAELCRTGAAVASGATSIAKELEGFLENIFEKYSQLNSASYQDLGVDPETSSGLRRSELAKFLGTVAKGREFGPLVFTYVDKRGEWLWLCEDHNKRFTILNK